MNAKTETKTTMYKWTACNPYSYLNGVVEPYAVHGETTDDAWKPTGKWQIP